MGELRKDRNNCAIMKSKIAQAMGKIKIFENKAN